MNVYLVIDTENKERGRFAYVDSISNNENVLKYARDKRIKTVTAFRVRKGAKKIYLA